MEKIINYQSLDYFAYSNDKLCKKPIRGIVVNFMWLNFSKMIEEDSDTARQYADMGIIYIVPYANPWAWMNKQTIEYANDCIEALFCEYGLSDDIPIVTTGSSMGGQQALVYTAYAKRPPIACAVICPVCDLVYHYTERRDLPRTLYSAFGGYDMSMDEALRSASPIHLADKFPPADFSIFHGDADTDVNMEKHSARFVDKMKDKFNISLHVMPNMGHCQMNNEGRALYNEFIINKINPLREM